MKIPSELFNFAASGIPLMVGTCSAEGKPCGVRAMGLVLHSSGDNFTVLIPDANLGATATNIKENPQIAVSLAMPGKAEAYQIKGRCLNMRSSTDAEQAVQKNYLAEFSENVTRIGLSSERFKKLRLTPSTAFEITVEELFCQTPGKGAGDIYTQRKAAK